MDVSRSTIFSFERRRQRSFAMHANSRSHQSRLPFHKMGVHHQHRPKKRVNSPPFRLLHLTIPSTSSFLYKENDFIWNNPNELDLLDMKKAPTTTTVLNKNYFLSVLPCIRRLFTVFDSICPDIYRIHCPDSARILQEIICLAEEYLHIRPPIITIDELLHNEQYFDDYIDQLRLCPPGRLLTNRYYLSTTSTVQHLRCFGQGIRACDTGNELHRPILFCFELATTKNNHHRRSLTVQVLVIDPHEQIVPTDVQLISTDDQGHTNLYSCTYTPRTQAGIYKISLLINHVKMTDHNYAVLIRNSISCKNSYDIKKPLIEKQEMPLYDLDGCSTSVIVNEIARFRLQLQSSPLLHRDPSADAFSLSIIDPFGHSIVVQRRILSPQILELIYQPMSIGIYQLFVLFDNKIDRQLTIDVVNDESNQTNHIRPFGPGLQRAIVGLPTEFYVELQQQTDNHPGQIEFLMEPSYQAEIDYEQQMAIVRYVPLREGVCPVHILHHGKDIRHSPFLVQVQQNISMSNVKPRVRVTSLSEQILVHRPVEFQVLIDNPFDDPTFVLHVDICTDEQSPSVSIRRRHRSCYLCSFIPISLGHYTLSIDYAGIVAEQNPFHCLAIQEKDVLLSGPAINDRCLTLNEPTHFSFSFKNFLTNNHPISRDGNGSYESGYSSNDETSTKSSSLSSTCTDPLARPIDDETKSNNNYRVTITDGQGNVKSNVSVKELHDNVRVDFTPDEQILYINISCTW